MLSISGLTKTYRNGVRALDGVTMEIERGLFGLLGPNGAGKSTLMRTIATLQPADGGRISFDGRDVLADPRRLRRQLGYLPQDFGVYPKIPAAELLDHIAVLKGITGRSQRRDQVDSLLQLTNLHDARSRAVSTFSGGMKQRFGIAQALLGDPRIIIVDEPTAGLDPEERNRFHNLLSEIGENVVVILSTHIVADVRELCSRMAVLADGQVLLQGRPADLVAALQGRIWQKTVGKGEVAAYRSSMRLLSTQLFEGKTQIHVIADVRPDPTFNAVDADLEDVYFAALTARTGAGTVAAC